MLYKHPQGPLHLCVWRLRHHRPGTCGLDPHTAQQQKAVVNHCCTCFFLFCQSFLLPWKPSNETVQNEIWDNAERWDSRVGNHSVTGEEQRISTNRTVANGAIWSKLKGHLAATALTGKRKVRCGTTYTWNLRSMNQGELEIVKQGITSKHCSAWF